MSYAPVTPHGDLEEIGSDVFMVRGSIKMNPVVRLTRNMAVVRSGNELTVINPIRLDARGEQRLASLGTVSNILRLGSMHGVDDPYYADAFKARLWAQAGGKTHGQPPIDVELDASTDLPFPGGELFCFREAVHPECALLLRDANGLLLTCDAIQNYGDYSYCNLPARLMMPLIGFPRTTLIGPIWLKLATSAGGSLESEFRRLLGLDFDRLLSAHGTLVTTGAHAAVERAVAKAFASG